ncbi:uncharacterized protein LOC109818477 isoform X2 [Cajanus cajan]|uniref:uncharacterized protein LOC109818477 isoform X2 n=1 Tax=Cajanus cajan TaxID=3821 RepID=UPI00098DA7FB|nr:uncharacterized protein LOC109818477 isoform X2 [Cajanus cajan]
MGDSKRWTVTYTKHIKQKRKVYQDGFLNLHVSTSKVLLYDECEKLLECRLLKSDETVTSGETLVFNGYLVDIGDPEGDNKPESDFNDDKKHKNQSRFRTPSDAKYSKVNEKENVACVRRPLSPSQKIIREFKKRELLKYGSPKISQENPEPSTKEWHVLYTTQVTQKAKKYHDGFLRLVLRGFSGAQVMLFDTNRKLLDSRFLKKDDVIKPGESISFDSYLIDIDEQTEDQGSCTPDSNVQGDRYTNVKRMKLNRQKTLENETHVIVEKSEWKVLYTTQLTQKSKKYHEGFLQIELCGSFGKQAVLCDLSRSPLERRFLKKDEVIRAGESIYFDGHLVEVGEPKGSHHSPTKLNEGGTNNNVVERRQLGHGQNDCHKVNPSFAKGKPPSELCDSGLNFLITKLEEIKSIGITPSIKPLRDANQILSILQNPNPKSQESYVTGGRSLNGSRQSTGDRQSTETVKSPDIVSSASCSGGSFQFTENVNMSHQSLSKKDAQTNIRETDVGSQSCLITNEGECGEEFSGKRETLPSFDLGF